MFFITSCDNVFLEEERLFSIKNNTDTEMILCVNWNFPDTLLHSDVNYTLPARKSKSLIIDCIYEKKKQIFPIDTVGTLFIVHPDTITKYSWEEIRDKRKFSKRFFVGHYSLKNNNYELYYP